MQHDVSILRRAERSQSGRSEPVTLLAEPPLHAEIMMSSSMMESLMRGLPDWTTKTSFSRTLVRILTLVSPLGVEFSQ